MFEKILIANRGEIAVRIIRACRKLGIKAIVVYTNLDKNSAWYTTPDARDPTKLLADEAYEIGSYLNIGEIIDAAKKAQAEAIHPGYGFLSENAEFAQACKEEQIIFIGPKPDVMEMMGDKSNALEVAEKLGVPTLKRSKEIFDTAEPALICKYACEVGYPLMLKPSGGGGGIGMMRVEREEDLLPCVEKSRAISARTFRSSRFYFEKYLAGASHIEVQLMGDQFGNIVHFFERDCSIQRRNQKIVEEAPARKLHSHQKNVLYEYALKIAEAVQYSNAGTVEFIVSEDGKIYFLEMNTRIQVEHGVSEMLTGRDLVEFQIRVASGEKLPFSQKEIKANGHAIEARIYPEIVSNGAFVPQSGTVRLYAPPKLVPNIIRFDTALFEGYEVLSEFEPLMGKLICRGFTECIALRRMSRALRELAIIGVPTNIQALEVILNDPSFVENRYHTNFFEDAEVWEKLKTESSKRAVETQNSEKETRIIHSRLLKNIGKLT